MIRLGSARSAVCAIAMLMGVLNVPTTAARAQCVGDCNGSFDVTVDEIITMVNIALGTLPISSCLAGDVDHSGDITVDEIVAAVINALNGCSQTTTPTPTATATPTGGTGGVLGTRRFTINAARSPFTAVLSPGFSVPLGSGFMGQSNGHTEAAYVDLRAGKPDANGFAFIDIVASSDYFFVDATQLAQIVLCIKPMVPVTRAGVVECNGGLDFSIALEQNHHLGQVGVDGYTAKQCVSTCTQGVGCGSIESPNQICATGLIGEQCRVDANCNAGGTCGLGRLCVAGNIGDPCTADADCNMGAVTGVCAPQPRCTAGKQGSACRADGDCDTNGTAEDGVCGQTKPHPGVCNSPLSVSQIGGDSGPGATNIAPAPEFGLNGLTVQITTERALPCGDEGSGLTTIFPLTTGKVRATILNFGNADRTCSNGTACTVDADCTGIDDPPLCGSNLIYNTQGQNFSCSDWQNPNGPGCFVLATGLLDGNPMGGDLVSSFKFCGH